MNQETSLRPSAERLQVEAMISEGGRVDPEPSAAERARRRWPARNVGHQQRRGSENERWGWLQRRLAAFSERLGRQYLRQLASRGPLAPSFRSIPERMHQLAQQTALVLQLVDDFRDGTYRDIPWSSVAIASAGLLYAISPADVIPDFVPLLGSLDDMAWLAVATRCIEKDLRAYCRFKGYAEDEYF